MRQIAILGLLVSTGMAMGQPTYPEGKAISRDLTAEEIAWLRDNPIRLHPAATEAPEALISCPGEYEPAEGIILAWEGTTDQTEIVAQMAAKITTIGNALAYVSVDAIGENTTCTTRVAAYGGDTTKLRFVSRTNDSIWIRDYGPRYVYVGAGAHPVRSIIDHTYNRPRPNDDSWDVGWSTYRGHTYYELPLVHGGGNFHLSSLQPAFATQLIQNENQSLTPAAIVDIWRRYQNVNTTITLPFPTSVDATQHIDMWMYVAGHQNVLISDWSQNAGSTQDNICDGQAASMAAAGYTVTRLPARLINFTHYTYANAVMCNNLVLVPKYPTTLGTAIDNEALAAWQSAVPGKTIVQIDCERLVTLAGVMHCICMHVPASKGRVDATGVAPAVLIRNFRGGQVVPSSSAQTVRFSTDDDVGTVTRFSVDMSLNSGATWTNLATNLANNNAYTWTTPTTTQPHVRLRITATDTTNLSDSDVSESDIFVGTLCASDYNHDGAGDFFDYLDFVDDFSAGRMRADFNHDSVLDFFDYLDFVDAFSHGCP